MILFMFYYVVLMLIILVFGLFNSVCFNELLLVYHCFTRLLVYHKMSTTNKWRLECICFGDLGSFVGMRRRFL